MMEWSFYNRSMTSSAATSKLGGTVADLFSRCVVGWSMSAAI
jgi:transposase InsO family protein